jgi:hypothetical protein
MGSWTAPAGGPPAGSAPGGAGLLPVGTAAVGSATVGGGGAGTRAVAGTPVRLGGGDVFRLSPTVGVGEAAWVDVGVGVVGWMGVGDVA